MLGLLLVGLFWSTDCAAQEAPATGEKITKAREKLQLAEMELNKAEQLFKRGSIAKRTYQTRRIERDIAEIALMVAVTPNREEEGMLMIAKLLAKATTETRELDERLFKRGSISRLNLNRSIHDEKIAHLRVKLRESLNDEQKTKFIRFRMAAINVQHAQSEFEIHERLQKRGSISAAQLQRYQLRLDGAQEELEQRRKELGAKATIVD